MMANKKRLLKINDLLFITRTYFMIATDFEQICYDNTAFILC